MVVIAHPLAKEVALVRPFQVFTPTSTPTITYVDRSYLGFEKSLQMGVDTPNMVTSVSGPSKSGKTVLIKKVVAADSLIPVSGSSIRVLDDLWRNVLQWMEAPSTTTKTDQSALAIGVGAKLGGQVGIFVAKTELEGSGSMTTTNTEVTAKTATSGGLTQVVKELAATSFVVFIDDFHYIPKELQPEIARAIKAAAEQGVKIITASVPHRSDDVVRANPELRGRVQAVDLKYWGDDDLRKIASTGFDALNVELSTAVIEKLAHEAFGSPQLMQALCLNLCFVMGVEETLPTRMKIELADSDFRKIYSGTALLTDFSSMLETLHSGPKQRGTERKVFNLNDGSKGDVYRAVLVAIAQDPPVLELSYDKMMERVQRACKKDSPVGSSVSEALLQMDKLSKITSPTAEVLEWDENVLSIVEPYFLFFLRSSTKLDDLRT